MAYVPTGGGGAFDAYGTYFALLICSALMVIVPIVVLVAVFRFLLGMWRNK